MSQTQSNTPQAMVGQDSREIGRVPIPDQVENLRKEMESLAEAKRTIERSLSDLEDYKRQKTVEILRKGLSKYLCVRETNALENEHRTARRPLLRELDAIVERIRAVKYRTSTNKKNHGSEIAEREKAKVASLQGIETALVKIANILEGYLNNE